MPCRAIYLAFILVAAAASAVRAHPTQYEDVIVLPAPEARGCYFERGVRYCGRYCYWEVNGKRYCHVHERHAYPQGLNYAVPARPHRHLHRRHKHPHHHQHLIK